jgi:hypothetical protein
MIEPAIVTDARVDDERITFVLADGREVSVPTTWSRRLAAATPAERGAFRVIDAGTVVEWPAIDEHIGVWTLLGVPEEDVLRAAGFEVGSAPWRA